LQWEDFAGANAARLLERYGIPADPQRELVAEFDFGIGRRKIAELIGNGHTVTYDASLAANRLLGGKTYSLANGGRLMPS